MGVGTSNPRVELHVVGRGAGNNGDIAVEAADGTLWTLSARNGDGFDLHYLIAGDVRNGTQDHVPFRVLGPGGQNDTLVVNSGKVGIGTQVPSEKLEIAGVAGTDGIKYPDGTKQTSAKLSCESVTNGWGLV